MKKLILIPISFIVFLSVLFYFYFKNIVKNYSDYFKISVKSVDINENVILNALKFLSGDIQYIDVSVIVNFINKSLVFIKVKNLEVEIYYKDAVILKIKDFNPETPIVLKSFGEIDYKLSGRLIRSQSLNKLVYNLISGKKENLDIGIKMNVFNLNVSYKFNYQTSIK